MSYRLKRVYVCDACGYLGTPRNIIPSILGHEYSKRALPDGWKRTRMGDLCPRCTKEFTILQTMREEHENAAD